MPSVFSRRINERKDMSNFFILNAYLTRQQRERLIEAGITFSNFNVDGDGILINSEVESRRLEQVLGVQIVNESQTYFDGVFSLALVPADNSANTAASAPAAPPNEPAYDVFVERWGTRRDMLTNYGNYVSEVRRLLVPLVKRHVRLYGYDENTRVSPKEEPNFFYVRIWCGVDSDRGSGDCNFNSRIYGYEFLTKHWYCPTGNGIPIKAPENGAVIAEVIGNNLFVYIPVIYYEASNGFNIFRRILEEVVVELSLTPQQRAERDKKREEQEKEELRRHHEVARSQYIRLCQGRMNAIKKAAEQTVTDSEQSLSKTQAEITNSIRELSGSQRKLAQLEQILSTQEQKLSQTYDSILQNPMVEEVTMRDGETLRIKTKELTFTDPSTSKLHLLGKFHIEIPVNGGNVRFFNLDRTIDGLEGRMQAPCVTNNGCTMLSNATQAFPELIANYDFDTVVQLALQVPCTIEPSEEYAKYANKWPEVQQQVPSDTAPVSAA